MKHRAGALLWCASISALSLSGIALLGPHAASRPEHGVDEIASLRTELAQVVHRLDHIEQLETAGVFLGAGAAPVETAVQVPSASDGAQTGVAAAIAAPSLSLEQVELAKGLLTGPARQRAALAALVRADPQTALGIVGNVVARAAADPRLERAAVAAIELLDQAQGADVDAELRRYYRSAGDGEIRRAAAGTLARRGDAAPLNDWIADVRPGLRSREPSVRARTTQALGRVRDPRVVPELLPMLSDASSEVRIYAIGALARAGSEATIPALEPMLQDPVPAVRDVAVRAVVHLRQAGPLGRP